MASKPTILEAQRLPFFTLFRACAIKATRNYLAVSGVFIAIIVAGFLLLNYGEGALQWLSSSSSGGVKAIGSGLWAVVAGVFGVIFAGVSFLFNFGTQSVYAAYTATAQLLPGLLEFTLTTCQNISQTVDGKTVSMNVCEGTLTTHFVAFGVAASLALFEIVAALVSCILLWAGLKAVVKQAPWEAKDYAEAKDLLGALFLQVLPMMAAGIILASVLAGLVQLLAVPAVGVGLHLPVDNANIIPGSLMLAFCIFVVPILLLQMIMENHVHNARREAREEHKKLRYNHMANLDNAAMELLREPKKMFWYRSVAVVLGGVAFLVMLRLGTAIWPGPVGFGVVSLLAFGVVGITLASAITCYPSLREGHAALMQERAKAEALYEAQKAEKAAAANAKRLAKKNQPKS